MKPDEGRHGPGNLHFPANGAFDFGNVSAIGCKAVAVIAVKTPTNRGAR